MSNVLLVSHLIVTLFLIIVVLFQRSEGGGLGTGSESQGFNTSIKTTNPLSKLTWILTTLFFLIAISLTILSLKDGSNSSIFEESNMGSSDDDEGLVPELPNLENFKDSGVVLTPPSE